MAVSVDARLWRDRLWLVFSTGAMELWLETVSSDPSGCGCMWEDGRRIVSCGKAGHQ